MEVQRSNPLQVEAADLLQHKGSSFENSTRVAKYIEENQAMLTVQDLTELSSSLELSIKEIKVETSGFLGFLKYSIFHPGEGKKLKREEFDLQWVKEKTDLHAEKRTENESTSFKSLTDKLLTKDKNGRITTNRFRISEFLTKNKDILNMTEVTALNSKVDSRLEEIKAETTGLLSYFKYLFNPSKKKELEVEAFDLQQVKYLIKDYSAAKIKTPSRS